MNKIVCISKNQSISPLFYNGDIENFLSNLDVTTIFIGSNQVYTCQTLEQTLGLPNSSPKCAPLINEVVKIYRKRGPTLALFVLDTPSLDKIETTLALQSSSFYPIFWCFLGIGENSFPMLEKMIFLTGRKCNNSCFLNLPSLRHFNLSQCEALFKNFLVEYESKFWFADIKEID